MIQHYCQKTKHHHPINQQSLFLLEIFFNLLFLKTKNIQLFFYSKKYSTCVNTFWVFSTFSFLYTLTYSSFNQKS